MATIATQRAGEAIDYVAAVNSDDFVNDGATYVHVKNASAGAINVTFDSPNKCNFGVIHDGHDMIEAVAAGSDKLIGPFSKDQFNTATGKVVMTFSATASVTLAVIKP